MSVEKAKFVFNRLVVEKLPITAPFLSRCWKTSPQHVAELLDQFYQENRGKIELKDASVKYTVCGTQKCKGKSDRHADVLIKIVKSEDLENVIKEEFDTVKASQIYSISLDNNHGSLGNHIEMCKSSSELDYWTGTAENLQACGLIQTETYGFIHNQEIKERENQSSLNQNLQDSSKRAKTEPARSSATDIKQESVEAQESKRPVYVSRKAASNPSASEPKKSAYVSRKAAPNNTASNSVASKRQQTPVETDSRPAKRTKHVTDQERERIEREKKALEEMLKDDIDFDDDDDFNDGVVVSGETGNVDQEAEEDYAFSDIDVADADDANAISPKPEPKDKVDHAESEDSRTTKQTTDQLPPVPATDTYTDADGYIVRKVNRKEPARTKAVPRTSEKKSFTIDTKPASSAPKKQTNLMSFFKKKS